MVIIQKILAFLMFVPFILLSIINRLQEIALLSFMMVTTLFLASAFLFMHYKRKKFQLASLDQAGPNDQPEMYILILCLAL